MNTSPVTAQATEVVSVIIIREHSSQTLIPFETRLHREAELAYEYADESLGRPAGLVR